MRRTNPISFWIAGRGTFTGYVHQLRERGVFFTHTEAKLKESVMSNSEGQTFLFSLERCKDSIERCKDSNQISKDLISAMKSGERVTIEFEYHVFNFPWQGDMSGQDYIIKKID